MIEFKLPEIGENVETAEVIRVLVAQGDAIKAEEAVLDLESEKAAFALTCPHAGKVAKIHVKEGDTISVGQTLLSIEEAEATKKATPDKPKSDAEARVSKEEVHAASEKPARWTEPQPRREVVEAKQAARKEEADETKRDGRKLPAPAGPATRKLARQLGVHLEEVKGSGPGGRITSADVQGRVKDRMEAGPTAGGLPPLPDFSRWGVVQRRTLNKIARTTAERLSLAWRVIPHVTQHELADITDLEAARRRHDQNRSESSPKITITALAIRAAVIALKTFPQFNSSLDASAGELIIKQYYNIGVAVDTQEGLLVPVIRDADRKSVNELAAELAELADKARKRALKLDEMQGGTFTITNLGGIGGTGFTPIVNYPEVAILGISQSRWQNVANDAKSETNRLMLPLSLSYDHRVINGADGVHFIKKIAELLSSAFLLLVEG